MKKILIFTILLLFGLCSCAKNAEGLNETDSENEVIYFDGSVFIYDFKYFANQERDIVIGVVQSVEVITAVDRDNADLVSFSKIQVEEVISGDLKKGEHIFVPEHGNGIDYVFSPTIQSGGYLKKGDEVMLFLHKTERSEDEIIKTTNFGNYLPLYTFHPLQGRIWLDENGEIDLERNAYQFSFVIQEESEMMYSSSEGRTTDSQEGTRTARQGETLDEFIGRIEAALADERSVAEIAGDVGVGEARREE
ncbi:MAG: hypothetical protein FWG70_08965 [Oscillospiraceae bacterium]|nr:hypothetical protein [Oscillospiraceae bacterium]